MSQVVGFDWVTNCQSQGCWSQTLAESRRCLKLKGKTAIVLIDEQQLLGVVGVADHIRAETVNAMEALHELGLQLVMLTGDDLKAARAVGQTVEIQKHRSELLPEEKVECVNEYTRR